MHFSNTMIAEKVALKKHVHFLMNLTEVFSKLPTV